MKATSSASTPVTLSAARITLLTISNPRPPPLVDSQRDDDGAQYDGASDYPRVHISPLLGHAVLARRSSRAFG
jgi:hypothetical protein